MTYFMLSIIAESVFAVQRHKENKGLVHIIDLMTTLSRFVFVLSTFTVILSAHVICSYFGEYGACVYFLLYREDIGKLLKLN